KAIVQGHCHHKAVMHLKEERALMDKAEIDYDVLESGCCGMAGAFGYEADKYDVSIACGERVLLPEVRKAGLSTIVMADGFSCKEQIEQQTSRHALHLAEVIQMAMRSGVKENYPEAAIVNPRLLGQKRSMVRTAIVTGTVLAVVAIMILGASFAR